MVLAGVAQHNGCAKVAPGPVVLKISRLSEYSKFTNCSLSKTRYFMAVVIGFTVNGIPPRIGEKTRLQFNDFLEFYPVKTKLYFG
jgi:hypothetical protein